MATVWSRNNVREDSSIRSTSKHWLIVGVFLFFVEITIGENKIDTRLNRRSCGVSEPTARVFNGKRISKSQIPWIVQIATPLPGTNFAVTCGGSIITRNVVLSAAHCFDRMSLSREISIYYNTTKTTAGPVNYVDRIIKHPRYNHRYAAKYDVVLLKVRNYFRFDRFVRPICLPQRDIIVGERQLLSGGWGRINSQEPPVLSKRLLYIHLYALPQKECDYIMNRSRGVGVGGFDSKFALCAKGYNGSLCKGDSGAPITMRRKRGKSVLVGIESVGPIGCSNKHKYSFAVRVYKFLSWIKKSLSNPESWQIIKGGYHDFFSGRHSNRSGFSK